MSRFGEISPAEKLFVARLPEVEQDVAALPLNLETQLSGDGSASV